MLQLSSRICPLAFVGVSMFLQLVQKYNPNTLFTGFSRSLCERNSLSLSLSIQILLINHQQYQQTQRCINMYKYSIIFQKIICSSVRLNIIFQQVTIYFFKQPLQNFKKVYMKLFSQTFVIFLLTIPIESFSIQYNRLLRSCNALKIPNYTFTDRTNLKMSKQRNADLTDSALRRKGAKSTDLKRRLFEVGVAMSPTSNLLLNTISSPKRLLARHPQSFGRKEEQHLLKFQPSHSPQLTKTSKDFQIRKSPKAAKSPTSNQSATLSSFYKPDAIRDDPFFPPTPKDLKQKLLQNILLQPPIIQPQEPQSRLDEYVNLVLRGVEHIDQFLYLVRGKEQNIYELELVEFQVVREHQGESGFEYYTVSKKGFCQYIGGKPHAFLDIGEWAEEKALYLKIKSLKFFYRFRRWKTLQMWRRTITKQRRQSIAHSLSERLFFLQPTTRVTLLQLRKLTLEMERSVLIIAKNQGAYTLESFKHCQERARREASLAVEEYSRESRAVVRKCFEGRLAELRENIKRKAGQEKASVPHSTSVQSPKESAFLALGFPSKMTYEHRSRLRKEAGRFLRFSYLVDSLHLSCLAGLYAGQVAGFIAKLEEAQLTEGVRLRASIEDGKEDADREKMFVLQLACSFKEVPSRLVADGEGGEQWSPVRDIRLRGQQRGGRPWVPRLCQHWLCLQPALDEVLDELSFLLREGLGSLKCFERWARHRQMQKYVSILQEWDDLVSENWEISQNDNLDPLLLLDSLDPALTKLKIILKTTETKLMDSVRNTLTELLNSFWHYCQLPLQKLQSQDLANPAETFQQFLFFTSKLLEKVTNELPHRIQVGVVCIQVTKIKTILGQKFAGILQGLRGKLPQLVEERTSVLNNWLTAYGGRLREQILNIDDFVKVVGVIRQVQGQFGQKRQECNQLAQLYQTMQIFRMDTRKRKDFETVTLKLKDQLEQLIITAEQNIERKTDLYTREVLKYHLPILVRDINKTLENVEQPRFLKLDSFREGILEDLSFLQAREGQLVEQRKKCESYMTALKIQGQTVGQLNELSRQIASRVELWKTLQQWQVVVKQYEGQSSKLLPLYLVIDMVQGYKQTLQRLQEVLPPNEILQFLKQSVRQWHIYLPILNGFSETLSETHWNQIYEVLPEKYPLDLKKREFTLLNFLKSGIGSFSKQIQSIFQKCRVEAQLQRQYQVIEEAWLSLLVKIRPEGRFIVISNGDTLKVDLDSVLGDLAQVLANPHAQSLKQYSITYDSLFWAQEALEAWLRLQERLVEVEKQCRLLDIKKLPDYNYFQNAERLYKQASKAMSNKGAQSGVKLGKILTAGVEEKLTQIQTNLSRVQQNIGGILKQHRRIFPSFYLFSDSELLKLITEQTHQSLQWAAITLNPSISRLQFQNQRISAIVTIDQDRLIKNPISVSFEVEQILLQIGETCCELNRRALRSCRYKAVENNLSSLVQQYNIQHLLAISRVDFSHYTTIAIDNQQDTPESLAQFRKVMRKDTAEDIKNRSHKLGTLGANISEGEELTLREGEELTLREGEELSLRNSSIARTSIQKYIQKYDTLLLQQLLYEEILDYLIKSNIRRAQEFSWASQLKFFWQDTPSDEPNITVRQLHLALKYGSDFIGSRTKVILSNEVEALLGIKTGDCTVYNGSRYNLERLANCVGYKMMEVRCTILTSQHTLKKFLIGCHFAEYLPFLARADQLPPALLDLLPDQRWVEEFKCSNLKRNSPYVRDTDKSYAVFLNVRDMTTGWQALQGKMRVVHYLPPRKEFLRCCMRLRGMFSEERTSLLLRIFQAVNFLKDRSRMQGVSLQQFLDQLLQSAEEIEEHTLFQKVLKYLKPKLTLDAHTALNKHVESLALLPFNEKNIYDKIGRMDGVFQCLRERTVAVVTGRGHSKKYFIKREAEKMKIIVREFSADNLEKEQLFGRDPDAQGAEEQTIFDKYMASDQDKILYFQNVTPQLLLSLQNLLFCPETAEKLHQTKTKILLDIASQQKFITPRQLNTFPIINFEAPRECVSAVSNEWLSKIGEEQGRRAVSRVVLEIIIPMLQNLCGKEELLFEQRVLSFFHYLSSIPSFKNPLEAALYALLIIFRGCDDEQLKLEYLLKKHIGEERLGEGVKLMNLFYRQGAPQEKLITDKEYLKIWMQENEGFRDDTYLLTAQLLHELTIIHRIHQNTKHPILVQGPSGSGKSVLFSMYRKMHHNNSFYMQISPAEGSNWHQKLTASLQRHGLNSLGARINYQQTVVMVEDMHLAQRTGLKQLELMLFYGRCRVMQKKYELKQVKFMLSSSDKCGQALEKRCLRISKEIGREGLDGIFTELLKKNVEKQWEINELLIQKMATTSLQLTRKIIGDNDGKNKQVLCAVRRILSGFGKLRIKEGLTVQKQIQKFWTFSLMETLKAYDRGRELQTELKRLDLPLSSVTVLSYTHLSFKPTEKRVQFLKDPKRLYNLLNEKIEKYNESDSKRYGDSFEFINFDPILQKIVTISHSVLLDNDHIIVGRRGTGKEALVKLCAFFNGLFYKNIKNSIKGAILQLIDGSSSAPHLLYKSLSSPEDFQILHQYAYCDFQSDILAHSDNKPRTGTRQKEKAVQLKSLNRGIITADTYVIPKAKLSCEEVASYRKSFRLVTAVTSFQSLSSLSPQVRSKFHIDAIEEVPTASIIQYNEKLLTVDGITCSKDAQSLLCQIFQHSRQSLGLSLRSNDDCVRLFSSFLANLVSEMVMEEERYCKVLDLLQKLKNCYIIINQEVARLHGKLKELALNTDSSKQAKVEVQAQLRVKSTAQSITQKLTEILSWLHPLYSMRLSSIKANLEKRETLELTFALTASYFIYLSNTPYSQRRVHFSKWHNEIPLISKMKPIQSFLSLFLLYQEQFNAEPVDHLPEFYENMSIVFHSAKPIAIRDHSARGKQWLQKNCSFIYVKQDQKDFLQIIKEHLGKSSNILIEVADQDSLNKVADSVIGTLLFLPEAINTVTLKGEEVEIHPQAKVYLLVGQGLFLPKELQQQFTVVLFDESELLSKTVLIHQFLSHTQREPHMMGLDYQRKIRSLRLDCENAIGQVAENIYQQLCGNDLPPDEKNLVQRLGKITDKLMVRAQNQFTKIREKEELIRDFEEKAEKSKGRILHTPAEQFYAAGKRMRKVLQTMAKGDSGYPLPSYAQYSHLLHLFLSKGMVTSVPSLVLAVLRHWGPSYRIEHYKIFAFLLVMAAQGRDLGLFLELLTQDGIKNRAFLDLIGITSQKIQKESDLQEIISTALIQLFQEEEFRSIGPLLSSRDTLELPLLWQTEQSLPSDQVRIVHIKSHLQQCHVKQRILSAYPKLLEPTEDDSLESLLKKCPHEEAAIMVWTIQGLKQAEKVVRGWSMVDKAIIFLHIKAGRGLSNKKELRWEVDLDNDQGVFCRVVDFYYKSIQVDIEQPKEQLTANSPDPSTALNFIGLAFTHHLDLPQFSPSDQFLKLLQKYIACIQWKYDCLALPVPTFKKKELFALRKNIENSDNPMTLTEKVTLLLQPIQAVLHPPNEIAIYYKGLQQRLQKLVSQCFSEEEFFKEAESVLIEGEQYSETKPDYERSALKLQLGWLIKTRQFFSLPNEATLGKYLREVQDCISSCLIYNEAPKVTRSSKRQVNMKNRRESQSRKGPVRRESQSLGKRMQMKAPEVRVASSPLASLYLLKQAEYFQQILYKIHRDLSQAKLQLQSLPSAPLSQKTITILLSILKDQPISSWKSLFCGISCISPTLSLSMCSILARRNELFTYYSKFSISESCELDFKYVRHSAEFLRAYFRSELSAQDSFMLATTLTAEETERGDYLRVNGMWGLGWRLTPEGLAQSIGESKPVQMSGCFIIKKQAIGVAVNAIDLLPGPEHSEPLMRLHAMSKKSQGSTPIKLYLRYE